MVSAHPLVVEHAIPVISEAEHPDLEGVCAQAFASGGLRIVIAAGGTQLDADSVSAPRRGTLRLARRYIITLGYVPGMGALPITAAALSEALMQALHGADLDEPALGRRLWALAEEAPVPDGADIAGRQLTLTAPESYRSSPAL